MADKETKQQQVPNFIWIDSGDLLNAEARGYANYFLTPYSEEQGPSDGESVRYMRLSSDLGFALVKQLDGRALTDAEKALLSELHDVLLSRPMEAR